jgi:ketol-acid reductoisomerase
VGELKLIAELIEARGIAGMREAISNTAELGAVIGGPRIVDESLRARMREILSEVRAGRFSELLRDEEASVYPRLREARERSRGLRVEQARKKLSD